MNKVVLSKRQTLIYNLLSEGYFLPVNNYCDEKDYYSILEKMETVDGHLFPYPIVLAVDKAIVDNNNQIELIDDTNRVLCQFSIDGFYEPNVQLEIDSIIGVDDKNHPMYSTIIENKDKYYVYGSIHHVNLTEMYGYQDLRRSRSDIQKMIKEGNYNYIVGFQTRNPIHKSHFNLTINAFKSIGLENGLLLLNPVSDTIQETDIELGSRVACYREVVKKYPKEINVIVNLLDYPMGMFGPKEALLHAIIRRNMGCTHFIVGRDHAGPSVKKSDGTSFYGALEAQKLCKSNEDKLGIKIIISDNLVYVSELDNYLEENNVPEDLKSTIKNISGTQLRSMLVKGEIIPDWFSFPEINEILMKYYRKINNKGVCFYCIGLPSSGKSFFANNLMSMIEERYPEKKITLLDADIVRNHLSKGLGFSREDRSANIRRIGYVSSEIVKHGGICIVANIAPFQADRDFNRQLISKYGKYVEVFIDTPLEICESRDSKGLYKKAREGKLKGMTGIDDSFEFPINSDIVIQDFDSECLENILNKYI